MLLNLKENSWFLLRAFGVNPHQLIQFLQLHQCRSSDMTCALEDMHLSLHRVARTLGGHPGNLAQILHIPSCIFWPGQPVNDPTMKGRDSVAASGAAALSIQATATRSLSSVASDLWGREQDPRPHVAAQQCQLLQSQLQRPGQLPQASSSNAVGMAHSQPYSPEHEQDLYSTNSVS